MKRFQLSKIYPNRKEELFYGIDKWHRKFCHDAIDVDTLVPEFEMSINEVFELANRYLLGYDDYEYPADEGWTPQLIHMINEYEDRHAFTLEYWDLEWIAEYNQRISR